MYYLRVLGCFLLLSIMILSGAQAAELRLMRLFSTPAERAMIEQQKKEAQAGSFSVQSNTTLVQSTRISLDAVLIGKSTTIWINRQLIIEPIELNGIYIDPSNATQKGLWIVTPEGKKFIKQGQVYLTDSGKIVERYEAI
jgi:hypothetical protein